MNTKTNVIFVKESTDADSLNNDNCISPLEKCYAMVKLKTGFIVRTQNNYAEMRKIRNYTISISPFEFKDNYENVPAIDYDKYSPDFLIIDTKAWALMLRDLPRSVYSMAMQIAFMLEPNTNLVKITQDISSAIYSRNGKPARYWTTVVTMLQEYGFLVRTNQKSTYVINHNIIFKGDLNLFAKQYKEMYGNYQGAYNESGNFIIDKRNQLRREFTSTEMAKKIEQINYRANKYSHKSKMFSFNPLDNEEEQ